MQFATALTETDVTELVHKIANLREAKAQVLDELGRAEATLIAHMKSTGAKAIPHARGTVKITERREYDPNRVLANIGERLPATIPLDDVVIRNVDCKECEGSGRRAPYVDGRAMLKVRKLGTEFDKLADDSLLPGIPRLVIE